MSLDWANERYVRLYTRDTPDMMLWPWESRAIWPLLVRKADRSGLIPTKHGLRALAVLIAIPIEVVTAGVAGLLEDSCLREVSGGGYLIPNYIEAQGNLSSTYVVRAGHAGPIKVGRSKDPANRIATLQTACAEQLVILHLAPFDIEAELHRRLARWRLRGEWFSPQCISELAAAIVELSEARPGGSK